MRSRTKHRHRLISIFLPFATVGLVLVLIFIMPWKSDPAINYDWSGIRPEVKDSIKQMETHGAVITSSYVGYAGTTPQQWHRRNWLMSNASDDELEKLINYPNSNVKATALEALIKRGTHDNYKLINESINDSTTIIYYQTGCTGWPLLLSEYLNQSLNFPFATDFPPPPPAPNYQLNDHGLSTSELTLLVRQYDKRMGQKEKILEKNRLN